ncbi:hypothetical protein Poli38472_005536 [Pythium oligandrum]|uniref:LTD domain-containing protein n=1 Tax=Pythium oligandrum TaxID=41045 RepID=A0A8K1CI57_PYTOL|nr:hypothetical protein Poli38472_005536 [Pythium oligandrum]|eukprot:TMW62918.1 hypothetical protein Poli38472_005536 [Pythium oligandrum]
MAFPMLRRLRVPTLDRQVARGSMQICHKIVMQQLYISRVDTRKQWLVISNPSEEAIDLTGYTVTNSDGSNVFSFPSNYILLAGDEVTIWCAPGGIDCDTDNLLQPYLFWTRPDGSLRNAPFFLQDTTNEVVLLDPCMIEVASLRISENGKRDFRVLHCVSSHPRTVRSVHDPKSFCVGCLSPPPRPKRSSRYDVYVFSRYWNVTSDKAQFAHFMAVCMAPLLECLRALLIYILFAIFQQPRHLIGYGKRARDKVLTTVVLMMCCDIVARRLALWVKSGMVVSLLSSTSVLLDQLGVVAIYTSLERLYPDLQDSFRSMLVFELMIAFISMAALQGGFIEYRRLWHPLYRKVARWDYRWQHAFFLLSLGREALLFLLLVLPMPGTSYTLKVVGYLLVPVFTVATGLDFVRGAAMLLHLLKLPLLRTRLIFRRSTKPVW